MNESTTKQPIRLDKRLVQLIDCSRNEAVKYIEGGWVLVDGSIIDEPQFPVVDHQVELHADATLAPIVPATLLLNMPEPFDVDEPSAGLTLIKPSSRMADDDPSIRTLKRHFSRLLPTAPLEPKATGLMVFSQDGRVVNRLVKQSDRNEQEYIVEVSGEMAADGLNKLKRGIKVGIWTVPGAKVSWQNENRLRFALKSVKLGQIEMMCESVNLKVISMTRLRIGRISMGKIPPGQWRYLPPGAQF